MGLFVKVLIFVAGVLTVLYWWRSLGVKKMQQRTHQETKANPKKLQPQQTITCCKHCGVFVPEEDVIYGRFGGYCSEAHRSRDEQAHQKK